MSGRDGRWLTVLSCAVLLAGTGCSAGDTDDLPPPATLSAEPTTDPADSAGDPTDSADAGGAPAASLDAEFTPDELAAALATVNAEESLEGVILTDSDIRELVVESGSRNPGDLTVSPEECNVFADPDLTKQALNAALATMTFAGASSLQPDSVSLTSHASDEVIEDQLDANRDQLADCSEFEMDIAGETVMVRVSELEVATIADEAFAVQTVVQVPGTIQQTVSLTAVVGTTTINVTVGSSGDSAVDLVRGRDLVDTTVTALRGL
ncbi:hypothetical protein [Arthrobacter sp. TMN-50]